MRALKALILVGGKCFESYFVGFGTRLRPLTFTLPKPLVPFANKPMIVHQIEQLVKVGVEEIVLAVNYQPEVMIEVMKKYEKEFGIKISFSVEKQPLGTGGPIALAADILRQGNAPFFVLNSDIICDFPFDQLLKSHEASGATGTLLVTRVSEPSKYGVIVDKKGTNQIERFVEKPVEFISNRINAGVYVLSPKVLDMISVKPTSIEHDVFPRIAEEGELFFHDLHGFWMDVGQPKDYLIGNQLYLKHLAENNSDALHLGKGIIKNVLIHPSARIGKNCLIGPDVIIGPNVTVEDGVRIMRSTIMEHSIVKANSLVMDSIVGWKCVIGAWCRLEGKTVLGENVHIKPELFINGAYILPHKTISGSVENPEIIM